MRWEWGWFDGNDGEVRREWRVVRREWWGGKMGMVGGERGKVVV